MFSAPPAAITSCGTGPIGGNAERSAVEVDRGGGEINGHLPKRKRGRIIAGLCVTKMGNQFGAIDHKEAVVDCIPLVGFTE